MTTHSLEQEVFDRAKVAELEAAAGYETKIRALQATVEENRTEADTAFREAHKEIEELERVNHAICKNRDSARASLVVMLEQRTDWDTERIELKRELSIARDKCAERGRDEAHKTIEQLKAELETEHQRASNLLDSVTLLAGEKLDLDSRLAESIAAGADTLVELDRVCAERDKARNGIRKFFSA